MGIIWNIRFVYNTLADIHCSYYDYIQPHLEPMGSACVERDGRVPVFEGVAAGQRVVSEGALLLQALVEPSL